MAHYYSGASTQASTAICTNAPYIMLLPLHVTPYHAAPPLVLQAGEKEEQSVAVPFAGHPLLLLQLFPPADVYRAINAASLSPPHTHRVALEVLLIIAGHR